MGSFIEDLLNLHLARQGLFSIANERFCPRDVFDFVMDMFDHQTQGSGVHLSVDYVESLLPPNSQGQINKLDYQKRLLGNRETTNMPD